jgi:hypothetical protein
MERLFIQVLLIIGIWIKMVLHRNRMLHMNIKYKKVIHSLNTVCYYHDSMPGVRFGVGSQDEMCMTFILYFPKQPVETCGTDNHNSDCRTNYLGSTRLSSESEFGHKFGNTLMHRSPTQSPTEFPSNYPSKHSNKKLSFNFLATKESVVFDD